MPNLLQSLRSRSAAPVEARHITSVDDYLATINGMTFGYDGLTYGLAGAGSGLTGTYGAAPVEQIPNDLDGYARAAYQANGIVYACMAVRMRVFSSIRFQWQRINNGRPSEMFGSASLTVLEQPWPGGTTQDLLRRVIQDADLAGNSYWFFDAGEMVRLRPDWVQVVMEPRLVRGGVVGYRKLGYVYWEGGVGGPSDPVPFLADEVVHFAPNPDPLASYRGMSWLTPVLREIENDKAMGLHKSKFLENAATPNLSVAMDKDVSLSAFEAFKTAMDAGHKGAANAYKTLYLGGGADVKVIGADLKQLDFKAVQGAGETRIAAAAEVPAIIVGLSEGMAASTYSNFGQARRRFADFTLHSLWEDVAGSLAPVVGRPPSPAPGAVRLWYDARDVPALREDQKDAAMIQGTQASTINTLITAGFTPESAVKAVAAQDWGLLEHTGRVSVQLQTPGEQDAQPTDAPSAPSADSASTTPEVTDD